MPFLDGKRICAKESPCKKYGDRCDKCEALERLTPEDWLIVNFYAGIDDQYINQTPMGGGKDAPPLLTARLEAYKVAYDLSGYPAHAETWLIYWARLLHRLHRKLETVNWMKLIGKPRREITAADWLAVTGA